MIIKNHLKHLPIFQTLLPMITEDGLVWQFRYHLKYIKNFSLDIYQCSDCGAVYPNDTKPTRCEFCSGHLQGYKQNWSFSEDNDIKNRMNEIKKIRGYIENASKVSHDIINVKLNKITGRLDEQLTELEPLEQLRSYSHINYDISSNKGCLSENKREASEIDEKESDYMLKYFFICFAVTVILFLLSLTGVMFFIVSAIMAAMVLILGMIMLAASKKEKINSLLSEQKELEKTINKLEHELEVRSDKSSFNKINALLQEISELPESLFEIN